MPPSIEPSIEGFQCDWCENWRTVRTTADTWGETVCDECAVACADCNAAMARDEFSYEAHEERHCEDCYYDNHDSEDYEEEDVPFDNPFDNNGQYESILNYTHKPSPMFFGESDLQNVPGTLYFGIEHELEFPSSAKMTEGQRVVLAYNNALGRPFYLKSDGSITCGFEMVSHPMTREWFDNLYPQQMVRDLGALGAGPVNSYGKATSGVHIHVSRDAFTTYHMYKFLAFHYDVAPELIQRAAGRKSSDWASFDKDAGIGKGWTRKPNGDLVASYAPKMRALASKKAHNQGRCVAVNLLNEHTAELRYFRSTGKIERLRAYVQFVDAVYQYTKEAAMSKKAKSKRVMSEEDFIEYLEEHRERFPDIVGMLNKEEAYRPD